MKILISSAKTNDVRTAADLGAGGIFATPSMLAATGPDWRKRLAASAALLDGPIHMQSTERDTERILAQFDQFQRLAGERLVATICISRAGLAAARRLQDALIPTNVSGVVTFNQAVIAAQSGADYVSICFGCVDSTESADSTDSTDAAARHDGTPEAAELAESVAAYIARHRLDTRVVATDIQSPDQFRRAAQYGADFAAVHAALLEQLVSDPLTDAFMADHESAWKSIREIR